MNRLLENERYEEWKTDILSLGEIILGPALPTLVYGPLLVWLLSDSFLRSYSFVGGLLGLLGLWIAVLSGDRKKAFPLFLNAFIALTLLIGCILAVPVVIIVIVTIPQALPFTQKTVNELLFLLPIFPCLFIGARHLITTVGILWAGSKAS